MRRKSRKIFSIAVAMCLLFGAIPAYAADIEAEDVNLMTTPDTSTVQVEDGKFNLKNITYQTYSQDDDATKHLSNVTIDGAEYTVKSVTEPKYIRKDSIKPDTITYTSEVWKGDGEEQKPSDTMEQDGITYNLENLYKEESKSQERTELKNALVKYTGVEDSISIPESKAISFTDNDTKQEVTATLPLKSKEATEAYWDDSFQFDITVSGYNAESYMLGDIEIPASAQLLDYKDKFIDILALSPEKYEINSIEWDGSAYEEDGLVKRKAVGKGRKLVQDIEALYEGEVTLPETVGYVWVADYAEDIPEGKDIVYTMAVDAEYGLATATSEETGFFGKLAGAILGFISAVYTALATSFKEHPVFTSIPFVLAAGLIAFLVTRKIRHCCVYNGKIKCPYEKRTRETCKSCPNFYKRGTAPRNNMEFNKHLEEK